MAQMTVYEQRSKLLFELDRASARAAQQKSVADQLLHTANLSEDEVLKLRGLLQDLERKNRMEVQFSKGGVGLDGSARIPWRPGGKKVRGRGVRIPWRPGGKKVRGRGVRIPWRPGGKKVRRRGMDISAKCIIPWRPDVPFIVAGNFHPLLHVILLLLLHRWFPPALRALEARA